MGRSEKDLLHSSATRSQCFGEKVSARGFCRSHGRRCSTPIEQSLRSIIDFLVRHINAHGQMMDEFVLPDRPRSCHPTQLVHHATTHASPYPYVAVDDPDDVAHRFSIASAHVAYFRIGTQCSR